MNEDEKKIARRKYMRAYMKKYWKKNPAKYRKHIEQTVINNRKPERVAYRDEYNAKYQSRPEWKEQRKIYDKRHYDKSKKKRIEKMEE